MRNSSPSKLALWMEYSFADLDKTGHMAKLALLSAFEEVVSFDYSRRRAVFAGLAEGVGLALAVAVRQVGAVLGCNHHARH